MASQEKPVQVSISSTAAQRQFGEIVRRAYSGKEHILIQQNGLPVVVMLSVSEYDALMKEHERAEERERRIEELSRQFAAEAQRRGMSEEDLLDHVKEIRQDLFQERYGDQSKP